MDLTAYATDRFDKEPTKDLLKYEKLTYYKPREAGRYRGYLYDGLCGALLTKTTLLWSFSWSCVTSVQL